jgi:hypothetical protein
MLASNHRRGDSSLKRDICAILTFVATGFLFYLVQTHDPMGDGPGRPEEVEVVEQVSDALTRTPVGASQKEGGIRDS